MSIINVPDGNASVGRRPILWAIRMKLADFLIGKTSFIKNAQNGSIELPSRYVYASKIKNVEMLVRGDNYQSAFKKWGNPDDC